MEQSQPNILLIIADQLTPFLTGAYGHPVVKTPHLDRLVSEGVRFDAAYSPSPVCGPARAALMTGKHVSSIGAYDNAALFNGEEVTMAHYLTLAGYDTVLSGKMHFVGADQLRGFSRRLTTDNNPEEFDWTPQRGTNDQHIRGQARQYVGENISVGRWNAHLSYDEEVQFRAKEYLHAKGSIQWKAQRQQAEWRPFFLCVSYHHPHEPFLAPQHLWDLYEGEPIDMPEFPAHLEESYSELDQWLNWYHGVHAQPDLRDPESIRKMRRSYYALVTYIDNKVGELLDSLEKNGFLDNTVIVFTSDHGDMLCEKGMVQKRTFYEWSSRVPLMIRFPDGSHRGTTVPGPVSLIDVLPTFLDLANMDETTRLPMDGQSLLGLLGDNTGGSREVFAEYHSEGAHAPCFMLRSGPYKYVYIHGYASQLFDLEADPGEWNNLAGREQYREMEERLKDRLLRQFDPDAIDRAIEASLAKRRLVKAAMLHNGTVWDYTPTFDAARSSLEQYG